MKFKEWLDKTYTKKELLNLTSLNCSKQDISSLEGIEVLPDLEILYCHDNELKNLNGIEYLTKLRYLDCTNNHILSFRDLKAILNLPNLERIYLYNNPIKIYYESLQLSISLTNLYKLKNDIIKEVRKDKIKKLL